MSESRVSPNRASTNAAPYASATFGAGYFWWQWYAFDYGFYFYPQQKLKTGADESNAERSR